MSYIQRLIGYAQSEIGKGEDPVGSNRGVHVEKYLATVGVKPGNPWCAAFASWCMVKAAGGAPLRCEISGSAKRLVKNVGNAGRFMALPAVGALIVWHRGGLFDWKGHVGLVESYNRSTDTLITIEGNRTSNVQRFHYPRGKWREKLYRIAML